MIYEQVQLLTLPTEGEAAFQSRVSAFELSAINTGLDLKDRYLIWKKARNFPQARAILGDELFNRNESLQKTTEQYGELLAKLKNRKALIVGLTSDGGNTYDLGAIDTKIYKAILAEKGLNFGALFGIGILILELGSLAIAGVSIWKGLEYMIEKLKTENANVTAQSMATIASKIQETAKTDPKLAAKMTDAMKQAGQAATTTSNQSWWDKLTEGLKTIGVSGFGGLALGLFIALAMSSKGRRK